MTKEQYAGVIPRKISILTTSRDTLNPLLNTERLRSRLEDIEMYKYKHGKMYARWPHFAMEKVGRTLWRYKFNYAVKGFAFFVFYHEVI